MTTVLASAAIAALTALLMDRRRWRREDRLRWVGDRRQLYAAFVAAVDAWDSADYDAALSGEIEPWYDPRPAPEGTVLLRPTATSAGNRAYALLTEVEMIGSQAVVAQARAFVFAVRDCCLVRYDHPPRGCGGMSQELCDASDRRDGERAAFVALVRKELGAY